MQPDVQQCPSDEKLQALRELSGRLQLEERGGEAPESGRHSDAAKNKQAIQLAQSLQLPSGILALIKEGARDTHESKTFRAVLTFQSTARRS